ncbi:MAG TPA: hypothetical protein VLH77_05075 [Gammaproteobacteria bacterium]|nr:hypothetical protein [Gammaproteobacteria bacterium]
MNKLILSALLLGNISALNAGNFGSEEEAEIARIHRTSHKRDYLIDLIASRTEICEKPEYATRKHLYFALDACREVPREQRETCLEKVEKMVKNDIRERPESFPLLFSCTQQVDPNSIYEFYRWTEKVRPWEKRVTP